MGTSRSSIWDSPCVYPSIAPRVNSSSLLRVDPLASSRTCRPRYVGGSITVAVGRATAHTAHAQFMANRAYWGHLSDIWSCAVVLVTMMIGSALSPPAMCGHGVSLTWVFVCCSQPRSASMRPPLSRGIASWLAMTPLSTMVKPSPVRELYFQGGSCWIRSRLMH